MIDLVTSYDCSTKINRDLYDILDHTMRSVAILDSDAIRDNVRYYTESSVWFLMSHGNNSYIMGNDEKPCFDISNSTKTGATHVFAFCCNSANELGPHLASRNTIYLGFCDVVSAPPSDSIFHPAIAMVFNFIRRNYITITNDSEAQKFITDLEQKIIVCENEFDNIGIMDQIAYGFLRSLKTKLVIYTATSLEKPLSTSEHVEKTYSIF